MVYALYIIVDRVKNTKTLNGVQTMSTITITTKGRTVKQVIDQLNGKTFYSEGFGAEVVTVKGIEVDGKSGLLNLISTSDDVKELVSDYRKAS